MVLGTVRGECSQCINRPLVKQLLVRLAPGLYLLAVEGHVQGRCAQAAIRLVFGGFLHVQVFRKLQPPARDYLWWVFAARQSGEVSAGGEVWVSLDFAFLVLQQPSRVLQIAASQPISAESLWCYGVIVHTTNGLTLSDLVF